MNEDIRWKQRFNNFVKANNLLTRVAQQTNAGDEVGTLACIQAFQMTLELSWKFLKDYMKEEGLTFEPTPKGTFRQALASQYIIDGQVWMDALKARNLAAHTYNETIANELLEDIQHKYLPAFDELAKRFSQYYEEDESL